MTIPTDEEKIVMEKKWEYLDSILSAIVFARKCMKHLYPNDSALEVEDQHLREANNNLVHAETTIRNLIGYVKPK